MPALNETENESHVWQRDGWSAVLRTSLLTAKVDLRNPSHGLTKLVLDGVSLDGFLLGITVGAEDPYTAESLQECFVRQDDLVATYGETSFSVQVYWRATVQEGPMLVLDMLLSLQTPMLESFPSITVESQLVDNDAFVIPFDESQAIPWAAWDAQQSTSSPQEESGCLMLRLANTNWSYAEMTHPDDLGNWQISHPANGRYLVRRQLGGEFLEKGVIRRMRVRGALLPRDRDVELAMQCLTKLATEKPPLTA